MDPATLQAAAAATGIEGTQLGGNAAAVWGVILLLNFFGAFKWVAKKWDFLIPIFFGFVDFLVLALTQGEFWSKAFVVAGFATLCAVGGNKLTGDSPIPMSGKLATKVSPLLLVFLISFTALSAPACKPDGGVDWPQVAKCAPDVSDVIGIVQRVLFGSGDVKAELTELAKEHGYEAVACAVETLKNKYTAPGSAVTPERTHAAERAQAFLDDIGTEFAQ